MPPPSPPSHNRQLLQQIIAGMSEGVILVERDKRIAWVNQAAVAMHGAKKPADLGADIDDYARRFELRLRNQRKLGRARYPLQRALRGERLQDEIMELRLPRAEQARILLMQSLPLECGGAAPPDCYALVLQDITEQCEAEDRFERTFAANPAPAFIARQADLRLVKVNKGFLEMTGYGLESLVGRSLVELRMLPDRKSQPEIWRHVNEGSTLPQTEVQLRVAGGSTKQAILAGQPMEMGDDACMLFTFIDMELRHRAETALRQSEERFAKVFRLAPVPMLVLNQNNGRILDVNTAFEHVLGHAPADTVGRTLQALHLWRDAGTLRTFERALHGGGSIRNQETTILTHGGDSLLCLVSAERLEIGGEPCVLAVLQDISERKRSEADLLAAIEAVMQDTSWFSRGIIEKLADIRQPGGPRPGGDPAIDDLTAREQEVLGALCMGLTDAEIGAQLGISRNTVRNHLATVYEKIGVNRRSAAVVWARERGFTGARRTRRRGA